MSGLKLAAARKPGPTQHRSYPLQALAPLGCAVSQVVKTAQSRGRTERTLLKASYFCSPQAPSRGAGMLRTGVIRRFDVTLLFAITQVITPTSADAFPVVDGGCTGGGRRCKGKQGRRGMTALVRVPGSQ